MVHNNSITQMPQRMRRGVFGVLIVTALLATTAMFFGAQQYFARLEAQIASDRLVLYLRALNQTLQQHQHLPFVLAHDPRIATVLAPAADPAPTNQRLKALAEQARLEAVYVMDGQGRVQASSNADAPQSFMGQNYGFRPYFQQALAGQRSDYFAIGATTGRPGYFIAEPVASPGARGVVAIKLDISELQRAWEAGSDRIVALNPDGIVVLASDPTWLYRPIRTLGAERHADILQSRQFGAQRLTPLEWTPVSETRAVVGGASFLLAKGTSDWRGWHVIHMRPEGTITRQSLVATAVFGAIIILLMGFGTYLRSRRIEVAYAASEARRAELIETNKQLEHAQSELARTAKLAAFGHLAGSVTHELGQPISAFRNHLAAAEIGGEITSASTARSLNRLVDRMEAVMREFRFFARGRLEEKTQVDLATAIGESIDLLAADIARAGITLHRPPLPARLTLPAHQVQLEQAFTNLIRNAIHAVDGRPDPQIWISGQRQVQATGDTAQITVSDNGPGVGAATLSDLQEPFYSTKPSGVGMGLGLAITTEIIRDHGGALSMTDTAPGAGFVVTLPLTPSQEKDT